MRGIVALLVLGLSVGASAAAELPDSADPSASANPDPMAAMEEMEPMDHWMVMTHGYAFLTANRQGGPSGDRQFESQNHLMLMASRLFAHGRLSLLGTFTLEPLTVRPAGSPELFQRGETFDKRLLVDRQHPHDLFVQLAAAWERSFSKDVSVRLYLAPVGEPALGPVAFVHRLSSSENPTAPLAHHNQDSTHLSSDVVTLGLKASVFTLEGSAFHGREPDENRFDIDQGAIDSYSGRLTVRPVPELAIQISAGRRKHPEAIEAGDQTRSTASLGYQKATPGGFVAATMIVGKNETPTGREWGNSFELTWKFAEKNFVYCRAEAVDRDLNELILKRQAPEGTPRKRTNVQAATLGYVRDFALLSEAETGLGLDGTIYRFSSRLDSTYGKNPVSVHGFLRIRFGSHGGQEAMGHHHGGA